MEIPKPELIQCKAGQCALACIAMSCTFLGNKKTLDDVLRINGGVYSIKSWGAFGTSCDTSAVFSGALARYRCNPEKYAPPIVKVRATDKGDTTDHWVLVCDVKSDGTYDVLDPVPCNPPYSNAYNVRQFYK